MTVTTDDKGRTLVTDFGLTEQFSLAIIAHSNSALVINHGCVVIYANNGTWCYEIVGADERSLYTELVSYER